MEKTKKILMVEDDENFYSTLEKAFEGTEFLTIVAEDGEKGLAKAKKEYPDLILLDILLPGMDGIEVAKRLKEFGINTPIIYLTNLKDEKRISDAMMVSGGETDYIVKTDVHIENIIERIRQRLGLM